MQDKTDDGTKQRRMRRWWPLPVLLAMGLVMTVLVASASTTAPEAIEFQRTILSTPAWFGAYPDIAVGANGLVAALWTEGPDDIDKHSGRLRLAWTSNSSTQWSVVPVSETGDGKVFDAAVAVSGSTIHVIWSQPKNSIRYTTCTAPSYSCGAPSLLTVTGEEALQVDIVVDGAGVPHAVWVEAVIENTVKKHRVFYSRKSGAWSPKQLVGESDDSEGPAIAYANNLVHLVWTEWKDITHTDSQVNYCRRSVSDSDWALCVTPLSSWFTGDYLARNPSIAAAADGNLYAVWDIVSQSDTGSKRRYAIAYKHATLNGDNWQTTRTYPDGSDTGTDVSGATIFRSGEGDAWIEYLQFLRPHVSLAISGTETVPIITWHAQIDAGGNEEGLAQVAAETPHKVYWTYTTQPGSHSVPFRGSGFMYWATDYYTMSLDLCGEVDMDRNSATGRLALVGELKEVLAGQSPGNHLHAVYHEETGGGYWGVYYNNGLPHPCFDIRMPIILQNSSGSGGEE